jgi:hypothetical protein
MGPGADPKPTLRQRQRRHGQRSAASNLSPANRQGDGVPAEAQVSPLPSVD